MYIFIVNPIAGNGKSKRLFKKIISDKRLNLSNYKVYFTKFEKHAQKMSSELIAMKANIDKHWIIIGGDGTLHEVINGLKGTSVNLSFIPAGSGNDFARGLNLPTSYDEYIEAIFIKQEKLTFHLGCFQEGYFTNCLGVGFDAVVAHATNESSLKKRLNQLKIGKLGYTYQLIKQLLRYKPIDLSITVDDQKFHFKRCFLFTINNHPYFGGGMKINPFALNDEDRYHVVLVHNISKWKILFLFVTVFFGKHTRFQEVAFLQGRRISVESKQAFLYQVDGETHFAKELHVFNERPTIQVIGTK